MDPGIQTKRLNIRIEGMKKEGANTNFLCFVEMETIQQIGFRQTENPQIHGRFAVLRRSRSFASFQSLNLAVPASTARSASRSAA
jgi:hypothetical protein